MNEVDRFAGLIAFALVFLGLAAIVWLGEHKQRQADRLYRETVSRSDAWRVFVDGANLVRITFGHGAYVVSMHCDQAFILANTLSSAVQAAAQKARSENG